MKFVELFRTLFSSEINLSWLLSTIELFSIYFSLNSPPFHLSLYWNTIFQIFHSSPYRCCTLLNFSHRTNFRFCKKWIYRNFFSSSLLSLRENVMCCVCRSERERITRDCCIEVASLHLLLNRCLCCRTRRRETSQWQHHGRASE